ncbi:MMPL family transporter [Candidatus Entotheonella palauensis]|uniref:MMPL family transporter n=1 Tax=Candidatus Entotheonella palauensis TaxID=93172 RepID=UPI0015C48D84|nr:MMPL family transporter [Candidatus Entotheonella palauensis]
MSALANLRPSRIIRHLVHYATAKPWLTVILAVALAVLSVWYTVSALKFATSRNAMASSDAPYILADQAASKDFGSLSYLVVVIEPPSLQQGKQFVRTLSARLHGDTQHFQEVVEKIDSSSLDGKKLLYLKPRELRDLEQRLADAQDFIYDLSEEPGLIPLLSLINQEISRALVAYVIKGFFGTPESSSVDEDPGDAQSLDISFLSALFTEIDAALSTPEQYVFTSPWNSFFLKDDDVFSTDGYLTSKDDRFFFLLVDNRTQGGSFVKHNAAIRALRAHIAAVRRDFPDVQAGVTGGDALNNDEMVAAQRDTVYATLLALVSVAVLFIVAFRQVWRPLLVVTMLMLALCWTLGFTTLTVGQLNILSISFLPLLIGLGIDFGIHLLARYGEERAAQPDFDTALQTAFVRTGPGVAAAALTTALAFYAVAFTDFRGLAELGVIAGSGMLLCLLASFTVLPAMLAIYERHRQVQAGVWQAFEHDPLGGIMRIPWLTASIIGLVTLAGILFLPIPKFDYNLLNLQAEDTESVVWENRLHDGSGRSSWYALSIVDSLDELRRRTTRFEALPAVDRVDSIASLLPEDQEIRIPLVKELADYVADIEGDWANPEPVLLDELQTLLSKIRFKLQRDPNDWEASKRPSEADLNAARDALRAVQARLGSLSEETATGLLDGFQQHLMADFADKLTFLQDNVDPDPITLDDAPPQLRKRFVGKSGRYLMQVFARNNIWEREAMQAFVRQLQTLDANVTGPPVIAFYSIQQIQQGYARGGFYAMLVIIAIIIVLFRRVKSTSLALVPVLFGGLWTIAGIALLDLDLNMANLIILPLFLGIAVDDGIHIVHRMLESPKAALAPLAHSTGKAIVLTSLTTIVGFGSLMIARHNGIFSLGLLSVLAVACSLAASLVVLPLILRFLPTPMPEPSLNQPPCSGISIPDVSPPCSAELKTKD